MTSKSANMATTNNSAMVTTDQSPCEPDSQQTELAFEKEEITLSGIDNENRNPADEPPFEYTLEEDKRVLRKVDCWVLPVLCLTYMVQQLCKSALPWASAFDLVQETHLRGSQYSWLTSLLYIAQLVFQPVSSFVLVRFPIKYWVLLNLFGWSAVTTATASATSFKGFAIASFLLGMFQATIANSCVAITQSWYRRQEQSFRTTYWQIANSMSAVVGPLLTYGVGHAASSGVLRQYQAIFICLGLIGVASTPVVAYMLPNHPRSARFLKNDAERRIAVERLRDNNTGMNDSRQWKWSQFRECISDPKTWIWALMYLCCALPSGGFGAFGPIITRGFGYSSFQTILLQMPTGVIQIVFLWTSTWITNRIKLRFPVVAAVTLLPIAGAVGLLKVPRDQPRSLLACYYVAMMLAILNPLVLSWGSMNASGTTKKIVTTSIGFVFSCIGNIVGPQVYLAHEAPYYQTGLYVDIGCWCTLCILSFVMAYYLNNLNKRQEIRRVAAGRIADVKDTSIMTLQEAKQYKEQLKEVMQAKGVDSSELNKDAFADLTDLQNPDFHFVM